MTSSLQPLHRHSTNLHTHPAPPPSRLTPPSTPLDSMASSKGHATNDSYSSGFLSYFLVLANLLRSLFRYIKNIFISRPPSYTLDLDKKSGINMCLDIGKGFPSEALLRLQLHADWCRGFPICLGDDQNNINKHLEYHSPEADEHTTKTLILCKQFLKDGGIQDPKEIHSILSCLQQGFFANPHEELQKKLLPHYIVSGQSNVYETQPEAVKPYYGTRLKVDKGVATLEAYCNYQLVPMEGEPIPIPIQVHICIPDHRTGRAQCRVEVKEDAPTALHNLLQR